MVTLLRKRVKPTQRKCGLWRKSGASSGKFGFNEIHLHRKYALSLVLRVQSLHEQQMLKIKSAGKWTRVGWVLPCWRWFFKLQWVPWPLQERSRDYMQPYDPRFWKSFHFKIRESTAVEHSHAKHITLLEKSFTGVFSVSQLVISNILWPPSEKISCLNPVRNIFMLNGISLKVTQLEIWCWRGFHNYTSGDLMITNDLLLDLHFSGFDGH